MDPCGVLLTEQVFFPNTSFNVFGLKTDCKLVVGNKIDKNESNGSGLEVSTGNVSEAYCFNNCNWRSWNNLFYGRKK